MQKNLYLNILAIATITGTALLFGPAFPALASEELVIQSDHSKLIVLPQRPATVVVGNPSIADVTLDGERLLLHGRGFGNTNVTILDDNGQPIEDYEVYVSLNEANSATVFKNGARHSYSCAGDCQPVLTVGDQHKPYFENLAEQIKTKTRISRDQGGGDETGGQVIMPAPLTQ